MALYALWVVPKTKGPGADAIARRLWEGTEDERSSDPTTLTKEEIRATADALRAAHRELVVDPSAYEENEPGLGLEVSTEGSSLDVDVDTRGVLVNALGHGSPAENEADIDRALAIVKTAATRLEGVVFDPQLDRLVDPDVDGAAIRASARGVFAAKNVVSASGGFLAWLPLLAFVVIAFFARSYRGLGFFIVPVAFFAALAAGSWIKRRRAATGAAGPATMPRSSSSENRPINP